MSYLRDSEQLESQPDSRLRMLMHYKVLHLGVCFILAIALIGGSVLGGVDHFLIRLAVGCFLLAGGCGVVLVSNLVQHRHYEEFHAKELGFLGATLMKADAWLLLEQVCFWLGFLPLAIGFIFWGPDLFRH